MSKTLILLFITLLCWGVTPIIEKTGLKSATPFAGVTIRSIAITIGLLIMTFVTGRTKEVFGLGPKDMLIFTISGFLAGLVAMLAYFEVLREGETSSVVPIAASYPLVTAILSYFILSESFTIPKFIGTVLIVTGIWLVKI
jgi:transporter family protein